MTNILIEEIAAIDPGWKVPSNEPVFIEVASKKQLPISKQLDYSSTEALMQSFEASQEETFFSVMRRVFGENRA